VKKSQKRVGAKPGHKAGVRPLVENPKPVIEAKVERHANCDANLAGVAPDRIIRHRVEELPAVRRLVIERKGPDFAYAANAYWLLFTWLYVIYR
jgi:hypothetical protein